MSVSVGDPAPDLELLDDRGERWRIDDHRGVPLVIVLHRHFY